MALFCPFCSEEIAPEMNECPSCGYAYDAERSSFSEVFMTLPQKGTLMTVAGRLESPKNLKFPTEALKLL